MSPHPRPHFTYLGHSTVRCDLPDGQVMVIDPWVESNPACPDAVKRFDRLDAVLLTHGHSDHSADAVALCKRHRPAKVIANFEICQWLADQGVENCSPMNLGGGQEVLGTQVWMVRADHSSSVEHGGRLIYGGDPSGFIIRLAEGYTFYHAGDTALFSDMQLIAELWRPELAFLPIGDLFTMGPSHAARASRFLGVQKVIPIHWGTFPALTGTPEQLEQELSDQGVNCQVVALRPGESY